MAVLGIDVQASKNPVIHGLLLVESQADPPEYEEWEHRANSQLCEEAQLADLARAVRSFLTNKDISAVVVRDRDYGKGFRPKAADVRRRALFDGVLVAELRADVPNTVHLNGGAIARVLAVTKADVDARSESLFGKGYARAGAAALAADANT